MTRALDPGGGALLAVPTSRREILRQRDGLRSSAFEAEHLHGMCEAIGRPLPLQDDREQRARLVVDQGRCAAARRLQLSRMQFVLTATSTTALAASSTLRGRRGRRSGRSASVRGRDRRSSAHRWRGPRAAQSVFWSAIARALIGTSAPTDRTSRTTSLRFRTSRTTQKAARSRGQLLHDRSLAPAREQDPRALPRLVGLEDFLECAHRPPLPHALASARAPAV